MKIDKHAMTRRAALGSLLGAAVAVQTPVAPAAAAEQAAVKFSALPRQSGQPVVVNRLVLIDGDDECSGLLIEPGGCLTFAPERSVRLRLHGNVVVRGLLSARPSSAAQQHTLVFEGVDEAAFQGGGMVPLPTDTGLWVTGEGQLDFVGSRRTAWTRAATGLSRGQRVLTLAEPPLGWAAGDELVVTATGAVTSGGASLASETVRIQTVLGTAVTLAEALAHDHPLLDCGPSGTLGAEVLNVTRNVAVEGTAPGKSHCFITSSASQRLEYVALRHLGPRQGENSAKSEFVPGRYPLHLHMTGDANRGVTFEGLVARDCGSHAFVPHGTHGVRFLSCVAHNTREVAFWWDLGPQHASNDITYEACVASDTQPDRKNRGYRLAGFWFGAGKGNRALDCVATGVLGNKNSAGFHWPSGLRTGMWQFERCLAHNNRVHGLHAWQNNSDPHVIRDFVAVGNGRHGIDQGAYQNAYTYVNCYAGGNGEAAMALHSSSPEKSQRLLGLHLRARAGSPFALVVTDHTLPHAGARTLIADCTFEGYAKAAIGFEMSGERRAPEVDVLDCRFSANELWLSSTIPVASSIRVERAGHAVELRRVDQAGDHVARWNARSRVTTRLDRRGASPALHVPIVLRRSSPVRSVLISSLRRTGADLTRTLGAWVCSV